MFWFVFLKDIKAAVGKGMRGSRVTDSGAQWAAQVHKAVGLDEGSGGEDREWWVDTR